MQVPIKWRESSVVAAIVKALTAVAFAFSGTAQSTDAATFSDLWLREGSQAFLVEERVREGQVAPDAHPVSLRVLDAEGRPMPKGNERVLRVARSYVYANNVFLKPSMLEDLQGVLRAMQVVDLSGQAIGGLTAFQDKLAELGVAGTAAFFHRPDAAVRVLGASATKALLAEAVKAPKAMAEALAERMLQVGVMRLGEIVRFVEQRRDSGMGATEVDAIAVGRLETLYDAARWVHIYLLPAAEMYVALQPDAAASAQVSRFLESVGRASVSAVAPSSRLKRGADALFKAKDLVGGLGASVPAFADFLEATRARKEQWDKDIRATLAQRIGTTGEAGEAESPVIAVVDRSGSMSRTDPDQLRVAGLRLLADMLEAGIPLGVVAFDSQSELLSEATPLSELGSRLDEGTLRAIGRAGGGTSIQEALTSAARALTASGKGATVLLLTDGQDKNWRGDVRMLPDGVVVHTIAFSDDADMQSLGRAAAATGGNAVVASDAGELQSIFAGLLEGAGHKESVYVARGTLKQGQKRRHGFAVEPGADDLTGVVSWPGSDIDLTLVSPSGRRYAISGGAKGAQRVERRTYDIIRIPSPEPGRWQSVLEGVDIAKGGESYDFRASTRGASVEAKWQANTAVPEVKESYTLGLRTASEVEWTERSGTLRLPNGDVQEIEGRLSALAQRLSGNAEATVYHFRPASSGPYRLELVVRGTLPSGAPVQRAITRNFRVAPRGQGMKYEAELPAFIRRGAH